MSSFQRWLLDTTLGVAITTGAGAGVGDAIAMGSVVTSSVGDGSGKADAGNRVVITELSNRADIRTVHEAKDRLMLSSMRDAGFEPATSCV